jgi:hypothetical protein
MSTARCMTLFLLLGLAAGALATQAAAQDGSATALVTDRPGLGFSSLTVGSRVFQVELGLPQVTDFKEGDFESRTTSAIALVRYGIGDRFELRLGAPVYTRQRVDFGPFRDTASGYGDLEVGAKWHFLDNAGGRPSAALVPSVIVPTGKHGFTAEDPIYQLNVPLEWALQNGWGLAALVGELNGPDGDGGRANQGTFVLSAGWSSAASKWSPYGEVGYFVNDISDVGETSFAGGGLKYLVTNDVQIDASFDRGLNRNAPDWLFGFGVSARF